MVVEVWVYCRWEYIGIVKVDVHTYIVHLRVDLVLSLDTRGGISCVCRRRMFSSIRAVEVRDCIGTGSIVVC